MRVWTADGKLIAEFGEERRDFVTINEIPPLVKEALILQKTTASTSTPVSSPKVHSCCAE